MVEVQILPLTPDALLPTPALATTRAHVPPGYGVQEQCVPFTAASALGFLVRSPISFGVCPQDEAPADGHAFRWPLDRPRVGGRGVEQVFYVKDDPPRHFVKNAFTFQPLDVNDPRGGYRFAPLQPGISFFERDDQLDLFKLHLPYIWRTPPGLDTLFLPSINRSPGLTVLAGLVETDWYANPVNLVLRRPPPDIALHIAAGDVVAQVILIDRAHRRPSLRAVAAETRTGRDLLAALVEWYRQHRRDRSAYKKLARGQQGRVPADRPALRGS
jgi:hypothetical protein